MFALILGAVMLGWGIGTYAVVTPRIVAETASRNDALLMITASLLTSGGMHLIIEGLKALNILP